MDHSAPRDEVETVRRIIDRHELPDFVQGYDVRLGEFDGTPAVWVELRVTPHRDKSTEGGLARGDALVDLTRRLDADIFAEVEDRYPFYEFAEVLTGGVPV